MGGLIKDTAADRRPVVLAARGVSKSVGEVPVLFSIDFDIREGEIHALMGENGAGKSTLEKILSGFEAPTSGELILDGENVVLPPDGTAEALGMVLIHQEMNLAEHLTVTECLFLGREITRFGLLDRAEMRRRTRKALDELGASIN
ncbi:ATP-binding cassette domain-containing protein [Celeribacter sp.]|uniref:ATP-binding cassette domain-containing protein n=1 Tax=Celeribacter sp. TaxID=1890673 RepID=UPI003A918806